jgi:hypothetical protein
LGTFGLGPYFALYSHSHVIQVCILDF